LVADTNTARLFVFSLGRQQIRERITNEKTRRGAFGGWAQARYQRHVQNIHLHHMKEVVTILDRVVREESISQIVLACDDVTRPMLMDQLPKRLADKVIDVVSLDIRTPEHVVLAETLDALRQREAESDAERIEKLFDEWRAGGLAVVGPDETLQALEMGQVEEVLLSASPETVAGPDTPAPDSAGSVDVQTSAPAAQLDPGRLAVAGELVARAHQSGARLRFIEDQTLLAEVGGVGAMLRFRIQGRAS
jgi:peptide subunit release factor 1 (eRF1)